ncbi:MULTISPECIES: YbjN domain-containing protein [unclassified Psychrobacter]|uniref:YbjN domain-containing protein n=1 Tax=unclassified Psychrobacter TaxID=196806 RepID=UPI00191AB637|nr:MULTISPECIES: YbjN domain-containing protein [unclassified Psychrobacter]
MSQRHKLSLWQKIKQLLATSTVRSAINHIKSSKDLPNADFDEVDNQMTAAQIAIDDINTDHKEADSNNMDSNISTNSTNDAFHKTSSEDINVADNNNAAINNPMAAETNTDADLENTAAQRSESDIPIVDYLKQYFDDKQWPYNYYQPKVRNSQKSHYLSLRMRNKQLDCGYLFRVQENNKLLAVYGILPFLIPESHQSAAILLITQINYDMILGNLEMDVNDGEIRYKNAIDVEAVGLDDDILEHLLQSIIAMTTVAHEIFSDLVNNQYPAEELSDLLLQLRQQSDSRTFFLPTQFVQ